MLDTANQNQENNNMSPSNGKDYKLEIELLKNNLIDDDQTVLLMSYLSRPELFELHKVSPSDWFVAFKEYNENLS